MITIRFDREADALTVNFRDRAKSNRTVKLSDSVLVDFDKKGRLVTLELLNAGWHIARGALEALPSAGTWFTLTQAERESGLKASTLRVLLNRGRLRGVKRGRDWFVDATDLLNYMESREARGRQATNPKARRAV